MSDPLPASDATLRRLLNTLLDKYIADEFGNYPHDPFIDHCRQIVSQRPAFEMPPLSTWGP